MEYPVSYTHLDVYKRQLLEGDLVVTSGLGGYLPPDLVLGLSLIHIYSTAALWVSMPLLAQA